MWLFPLLILRVLMVSREACYVVEAAVVVGLRWMSRLLVERSSSGLIVWIGEERLSLGKHWWSIRSWKIAGASLPGRNCLEAFCSRNVGVQNRLFSDSWMRNWIEVCNGDRSGSLGNESERQNRQLPRTAVMFEQVLLVRKRAVPEPARPGRLISQSESADGRISQVMFVLFASLLKQTMQISTSCLTD